MSGFRWFLTLLTLTGTLTVVTGQPPSFIVRAGDDVTLPSEGLRHSKGYCEKTNWLFTDAVTSSTVQLVAFGEVVRNLGAKSDRLSITKNCSLVVKTVTAEDTGRYTCRGLRSGWRPSQDVHTDLSVVTIHKYEDDTATFSCSVSVSRWCTKSLRWLFKGRDVEAIIRNVKVSESPCSANVTFRSYYHIYTFEYGLLTCEVRDILTGNVQEFAFRPQSSAEDTTTATTTTIEQMRTTGESTKALSASIDTTKPHGLWRFVVVSVGLAALVITVMAVNVWTRNKGKTTQVDENTVHKIEDDGTVNYENLGDKHASVSLR